MPTGSRINKCYFFFSLWPLIIIPPEFNGLEIYGEPGTENI